MKLTVILLTVAFLQVNANGFSQTITYSGKNVPLEKVFSVIKEQAGFGFIYFDDQLKDAKKVTINVKNVEVEEVLAICMKDQPYDYTIKAKTIFIINKQKKEPAAGKSFTSEQGDKRINISGKVTGEQGEPVIGATIAVKGSDVITTTNDKGEFFLNDVEEDAVLVVTNVSYLGQEIALRGRSSVDVRLSVNVGSLDEAVVVAYNTTTQRKNVGAVTVLKGEQIATLPNRSFDKSLQGMVPGLLVTPGTGQPGGSLSNFVLRGIATAASTSAGSTVRSPLIVIDGVPVTQESPQLYLDPFEERPPVNNPLAQINPSDIESITVLKDAAAIALYGAKSSNGVILVTTRKGKAGKTRFNYRHQTDIAKGADYANRLLTQEEYIDLLSETMANTNPYYQDRQKVIDTLKTLFPTQPDGSFYPTPDWRTELFNDAAATISNEISMSGGNERNLFYLNFEYTKQNGVKKNTDFDRKSARFNFEHRAVDWLKMGLNSTLSYSIQNYGGQLRHGADDAASWALEMSPLLPVRLSNGDYVLNYTIGTIAGEVMNPVAANDYTNISRNTAFRGLSKFYAEANFLKHFKFSTNLGFDFMLAEAKEKVDPRLYDIDFGYGGRIEERSTRTSNLIANNILRYDNVFNKNHSFGILIGQEAQVLITKFTTIGVKGLSSPYYDEITSPGVSVYAQGGNTLKETLLSYFGQLNYSFKDRYLLSGSIRTDGSSRFGEDKRFGTYWSTGVGWIISEEPFMKSTNKWLSFFKLRGSIGAAGNAGAIDRFTPYTPLYLGGYLGNPAVYPSTNNNLGNPDAKWERTFSWNAGLELRLLQQRIAVTADVYERTTSDLIYMVFVPLTTGFRSMISNIGKMRNDGIEVSLSADVFRTKNFRWNIQGNWSTNKNELIKSNSPDVTGDIVVNKVGLPFEAFYLPVWAGVNPDDGSPMWIDSTGKKSSDYNAAIPEFAGKAQPDGFGGVSTTVSYKGLELALQFYYQYGFQLYGAGTSLVRDGFLPLANEGKEALDRWQKPGDLAANPKRIFNNSPPGTYVSTRYIRDGDFIRFQNASLAYYVPTSLLNRLRLTSLRVYVQGNNLAIWTQKTGRDPGSANSRGFVDYMYPLSRTYSVGVNLHF